jgi:hypothetical protein
MKRHSFLYFLIFAITGSLSVGQISTFPAAKALADLPGPPKNPPIFSQMTVLMQGGLQYEDAVAPKGPVASIERSDEPQPSQRPNPVTTKTALKFDEFAHLVKRTDENSMGLSTTTLHWQDGKLQKQETVHHRNDGKLADWTDWNQWTYDQDLRLSEFRSGRDKTASMDLVDFKYDEKRRLLGFEVLAEEIIEISYDANQIVRSGFQKYPRRKTSEQVQAIDDKRRVTDLKVSDMTGGKLTLWYHVAFKYDDEGRVIEQRTDPFKLGDGDDYSPLPGKLTVGYDDEKRLGEQKFYDTDGKLILHTRFWYDTDGVLTKLHAIDSSGKELVGGEIFVDAQYKSTIRPGDVEWEIIYDDHGNWTERRRWFTPADGSSKIMTRLIRQSIAYR